MKHWAILIGLDNYQFFQPLNYAQQDVQALYQFLVSEAGFPSSQCILLTERSPLVAGRSTYPSRENLCHWIEFLAQNYFQPDDQVWIFLNGYGICHRGHDYFVPMDGNPDDIEATCIAIAPLLNRLKSALPKGQPLLLLDISRSQGSISRETVGIQTAQIAHKLAIPTILSCQPGQFSCEISSLERGLFTVALVEGLRYQQGATLATLSHYLRDRLPELSEHYWQPSQHPVTICPPHLVHQPLLSLAVSSQKGLTFNRQIPQNETTLHSAAKAFDPLATTPSSTPQTVAYSYSNEGLSAATPPKTPYSQTSAIDSNGQINEQINSIAPTSSSYGIPVQSLEESYRSATAPTGNVAPLSNLSEAAEPQLIEADSHPGRSFLLWGGIISLGLLGAVLWRNWAVVMAAPAPATQPQALTAIASPLPGTAQITSASISMSIPEQRVSKGESTLEAARAMVRNEQATPYSNAIEQASTIPVNDAVYQEAQQDIAAWSQTIYDIAQERAGRKQFNTALMAVDLIPVDNQKLRPQADAAIAQWCAIVRQQNNKIYAQPPIKTICIATDE
jgi:hypothetical protein